MSAEGVLVATNPRSYAGVSLNVGGAGCVSISTATAQLQREFQRTQQLMSFNESLTNLALK
eukprot:CAMPEP_0175838232 /NCGR_PEP_ID=MMETSP0107_2-20121207/18132_1 /TAXON_ID=195067 ORGANISM="Goniomonas pacifica, Strain CCMP1869" /NCGR_SAMPLE_ID=MMETSP0107_2 /ASSEMBLY_ACC=CAM_ASM_000203 /LENGTH=60 /DNA_ID=CAMNT_0017151811 /DNA_START=1129 /DNA_END=1311 /DNA_ORIENTATION=-